MRSVSEPRDIPLCRTVCQFCLSYCVLSLKRAILFAMLSLCLPVCLLMPSELFLLKNIIMSSSLFLLFAYFALMIHDFFVLTRETALSGCRKDAEFTQEKKHAKVDKQTKVENIKSKQTNGGESSIACIYIINSSYWHSSLVRGPYITRNRDILQRQESRPCQYHQ